MILSGLSDSNFYNQDSFHVNTILLPIQRHSVLSLTADADSLFYSVSFPNNTGIDSLFNNNQKAGYARLIDEESNMYNIVYALQEYFTAIGNSYQDAFLKKTMEKLDSRLPLVENYKQKNTTNTYINEQINNIMNSTTFSSLGSQK